jgi:hypothetical protein
MYFGFGHRLLFDYGFDLDEIFKFKTDSRRYVPRNKKNLVAESLN